MREAKRDRKGETIWEDMDANDRGRAIVCHVVGRDQGVLLYATLPSAPRKSNQHPERP
jgi:hypothetical protein